MGLMDGLKVRSALMMQQKGDVEGAKAAYAALYQAGIMQAAYLLPYSLLLIRSGAYEQAKEVLFKTQKASDLTLERKQQLYVNYAVALWKLGEAERALTTLENAHRKYPSGLVYQTLGYLYVEAGDSEKALHYNLEALDYDDEDPVVLDNLGQTYYRLLNDKEKAKSYFDKAHALKPGQIDTLYFLARYDVEQGDKAAAREKLQAALAGRFSPLNYASEAMVKAAIEALGE